MARFLKLPPRKAAGAADYLALPAVTTGQTLLVTPHIVVADLIRQGLLEVIPGSRAPSGMLAYAVDRSGNPALARAFCRWLTRLCRKKTEEENTGKIVDRKSAACLRPHSRRLRSPFGR
ncbi:hypothetical protein MES4922_10037 [Mesorhizobium ventifaucium]|uniref:LysR substrate-binding domain-containing protein n=1 Tax=Mesorhizobium ventifaucium TaxID=666020 RepID=A0ABN8JAK9_9HYPH|nr:hypothetical protein MES4922_10037 [Mesorhizobium ventifaucium]